MLRLMWMVAMTALGSVVGTELLAGNGVRAPRPPVLGTPVLLQLVQNPAAVEFTASADHAVVDKGAPVVTRYDLQIFAEANQAAVVRQHDLGKPTPNASNLIAVSNLRTTVFGPLPAGRYVGKVCAVGPGGTACSAASNPFQEATRAPGAGGTPVIKE